MNYNNRHCLTFSLLSRFSHCHRSPSVLGLVWNIDWLKETNQSDSETYGDKIICETICLKVSHLSTMLLESLTFALVRLDDSRHSSFHFILFFVSSLSSRSALESPSSIRGPFYSSKGVVVVLWWWLGENRRRYSLLWSWEIEPGYSSHANKYLHSCSPQSFNAA